MLKVATKKKVSRGFGKFFRHGIKYMIQKKTDYNTSNCDFLSMKDSTKKTSRQAIRKWEKTYKYVIFQTLVSRIKTF